MESLDDYKSVALQAAREAGQILLDWMEKGFTVEFKGVMDLVTNADHASEEAIVKRISSAFPEHQILAEESGASSGPSSRYKWVVDPLDGTTNFTHRYAAFCVSIGLEIDGVIGMGVVYDPVRKELFVAERGKGAECNGTPLSVSQAPTLNHALLSTGFSYDVRQDKSENNFEFFRRFVVRAQGVRRTGSAAIDLCYVASGRFDGFWEMKLKPWDVAAGSLIVIEAGGAITDFSGKPFSIYGDELVASNGCIQEEMVSVFFDQ